MISRVLARFWPLYRTLPAEIRRLARKAYATFDQNPFDPSLHFKLLRKYPGTWSIRIGLGYRAVCKRENNTVNWFWIGSHADFDRDFS